MGARRPESALCEAPDCRRAFRPRWSGSARAWNRFCSRPCASKHGRKPHLAPMRRCAAPGCSKQFSMAKARSRPGRRFCSMECRRITQRVKKGQGFVDDRRCAFCGGVFALPFPSSRQTFCSRSCANLWKTGVPLPPRGRLDPVAKAESRRRARAKWERKNPGWRERVYARSRVGESQELVEAYIALMKLKSLVTTMEKTR
jgi:hypothetical protein